MGKDTGLGAALYIDGVDVSGDTQKLDKISKSLKVLDFTGINKSAFERQAGQLDGNIDMTNFFNPSAGQAHPTLSTLPRTDRVLTYVHKGTLIGTPVASIVAKQVNYDPTRENSGALTLKVQSTANAFWLDWGLALTAGKRTDTTATNGAGVDFQVYGAPANFGGQFYLHVFAFTGTNCTIKIQDSADNSTFADLAGASFTTVTTAPVSQRLATGRAATTRRYMRAVTSGTFTSITFAVAATVNISDMTI
jgi:hypothetical protein